MKKRFSRLSVVFALPLMMSACGKGMHMTLPSANGSPSTANQVSSNV